MKKVLLDILAAIVVTVAGVGLIKLCWAATEEETAQRVELETEDNAATSQEEAQKNRDFEEFVLGKMDLVDGGWTLLEHNDKGRKTKTDYLIEVEGETMIYHLAIECTWVKSLSSKGLYWVTEPEMKSILKYADEEDAKVFLIAGVGGTPKSPKSMFIVPVRFLQHRNLTPGDLANYELPSTSGILNYDGKLMTLK